MNSIVFSDCHILYRYRFDVGTFLVCLCGFATLRKSVRINVFCLNVGGIMETLTEILENYDLVSKVKSLCIPPTAHQTLLITISTFNIVGLTSIVNASYFGLKGWTTVNIVWQSHVNRIDRNKNSLLGIDVERSGTKNR